MKKICFFVIVSILLPFLPLKAGDVFDGPSGANIAEYEDSAEISWKNPENPAFSKTILFRSSIPIEKYFSYEAVEHLCDKIYEGDAEFFKAEGLAKNLSYYFILFSVSNSGNYSNSVILQKNPSGKKYQNTNTGNDSSAISNLSGANPETVNEVSFNEASTVYSYNKTPENEFSQESNRLSLFIIVKSPHDLSAKDKDSIAYFIESGTPTTIILGTGERAGVLNSYLSAFNKLPRGILEWQDVIKIANGRWPNQRNLNLEERAADVYFSSIYERKADMANPNDNAAVTVIAYGLRPSNRNLESEKNAIHIFRTIFQREPIEAFEWDLVRAIAYSGAVR